MASNESRELYQRVVDCARAYTSMAAELYVGRLIRMAGLSRVTLRKQDISKLVEVAIADESHEDSSQFDGFIRSLRNLGR